MVLTIMAAKKRDMAAAVASHLVKVQPEKPVGGSVLPMRLDAPKAFEKAEAILLRA